METTLRMQQIQDAYGMLRNVQTVENTRFNYAVVKTLAPLKTIVEQFQRRLDYTPEMMNFLRQKREIVKKYTKAGTSFIENEDQCRSEMAELILQNDHLIKARIRMVDQNRKDMRETMDVKLHMIPLTEEYIPENIPIRDLMNAAYLIQWDKGLMADSVWLKKDFVSYSFGQLRDLNLLAKQAMTVKTMMPEFHRLTAMAIAQFFWQVYSNLSFFKTFPEYMEWIDEYESRRVQILERLSEKDIYGDPVQDQNTGQYKIADQDQLEIEMAELESQCREIIERKDRLQEQRVTFEVHKIPYEWLSDKLSANVVESILPIVAEPNS